MIGIVIPAHNEEDYLDQCLCAVRNAACHPALRGESVGVVVVLDHCSDGSADIVARHAASNDDRCRIEALVASGRNVGAARAAGAERMLAEGARWLAFTDADTCVGPGWLVAQLSLGADVVCGTIAVDDWSPHCEDAETLREHFRTTYTDADGHRHIHGANLGVCALAYRHAGGFTALACSEDVALVRALELSGASIAWSAAPRVSTSARRDAKARGGFGDTLLDCAAHYRTQANSAAAASTAGAV